MTETNVTVALGYSDVPPGHIASVVTCLEMLKKPELRNLMPPTDFSLERVKGDDLGAYRNLFRKIGANWLWYSRILMSDGELRSVLTDDAVHVFALRLEESDVGMLELDFRASGQCELAFLGLDATSTGRGLGRYVMNRAIEMAWSHPIQRMWVHTCTFDHPSALSFYVRSGFTPYAFKVEMQADPRLTGHLPLEAAPQVPVIAP